MSLLPTFSEKTFADLARFDTPTICNAIELFYVRPRNTGFMSGAIKACFPHLPPMVGLAVTSTFRSMAPPRSGDVYAGLSEQVESFAKLPGPAIIVYQDLDDPVISATFGEVMCTVFQSFGARGIVTSGGGRDLEQVERLKFPAFAGSTICAHGYCHTPTVNVPVTVGGVCIYPGDLLHGDLNGITTIPHEIASEIPQVCDELAQAEKVVLDYCAGGKLTPQGLAEARSECAAMFKRTSDRVRKT